RGRLRGRGATGGGARGGGIKERGGGGAGEGGGGRGRRTTRRRSQPSPAKPMNAPSHGKYRRQFECAFILLTTPSSRGIAPRRRVKIVRKRSRAAALEAHARVSRRRSP